MPGGYVPPAYRSFTIEDYTNDKLTRGVVEEYLDSLKEMREQGKGLLLVGEPGVGKTMLSCIVLNAASEAGYSVRYMPLATYQHLLLRVMDLGRKADRMITAGPDRYGEELDKILMEHHKIDETLLAFRNYTDFVVIDDVGKEHGTGTHFIQDEFDYLVRTRGDAGLVTLMTSNLRPDQWSDVYSPSMRSYIHQICNVLDVRGADARR